MSGRRGNPMPKLHGPQFARQRRLEARRDRDTARPPAPAPPPTPDPLYQEMLKRISRVERWFRSPLFACVQCGRCYAPYSTVQLGLEGGKLDLLIRMVRIRRLPSDPRLLCRLDRCPKCAPLVDHPQGELNGMWHKGENTDKED